MNTTINMTREEYEKKIKTVIRPIGFTPNNWVSGEPIRIFGLVLFVKWRIIKSLT